jgi:hypothetical protein
VVNQKTPQGLKPHTEEHGNEKPNHPEEERRGLREINEIG